jgi:hypothetical protein
MRGGVAWDDLQDQPDHGMTEFIWAATMDAEEFPHRAVPLKVSLAAVSLGETSLISNDPWIRMSPAALRSSFHPRNQARPWVVFRSDDDDVERIHIRLISGRSPNQST